MTLANSASPRSVRSSTSSLKPRQWCPGPAHWRRREDGNDGIVDARRTWPGRRCATAMPESARPRWLHRKGLQSSEHNARRGAVDEPVDGEALETATAPSTAGSFNAIADIWRITLSVRSSVAPSGSCAKLTRYCLSCSGTKPEAPGGTETRWRRAVRHRPRARLRDGQAPHPRPCHSLPNCDGRGG